MAIDRTEIIQEVGRRGWSLTRNVGFTDGDVIDQGALRELCRTIGRPSSRDGDRVVWPVRPVTTAPGATFSMRSGAAALHTDAAYRSDPEPWVVLFCVRPAADGGLSTLLTLADLMAGLPAEIERALRQPIWRWQPPEVFGGQVTEPRTVLGPDGDIRWRYDTLEPDAEPQAAAARFHEHLTAHPLTRAFQPPVDSMLVVDNHRTLHGRTAFTDPGRLLLRVRLDDSPGSER